MKPAALAACGLALLAGCRDRRPRGAATPTQPTAAAVEDVGGDCAALPYPRELPVPEASGAVWLSEAARLLVVSDSGNDGAYVEVDAAGAVVGRGQIPLGVGGDDVEGLSRDGGLIWGVTSSGWMRAWRRTDRGYELADAFALDDRCAATSVNCGDNYEGLCLAPAPLADGCDGYLAAKGLGALVCVHRSGARFTLDRDRRYPVTGGERLADCAIGADGTVWTGDNGFGFSAVRQWSVAADGVALRGEAALGVGFPEVLAFGPEAAVYRFSDFGGTPSLATAFRCPRGLPKAGPPAAAE